MPGLELIEVYYMYPYIRVDGELVLREEETKTYINPFFIRSVVEGYVDGCKENVCTTINMVGDVCYYLAGRLPDNWKVQKPVETWDYIMSR